MMSIKRWLAALTAVLVVIADATVLAVLRPAPTRLATRLAHPGRWLDEVGADTAIGTLAGAGLWLLAAWVAIGLLAALAGRLPGAVGATVRRIAAIALPRALQRVLAGAAGLGVLLSPTVASAASHPGGTDAASAAASTAVPSPLPPTDVLPAPQLPIAHSPMAGTPGTRSPADHPLSEQPTSSIHHARPRTVTVRPGDSLWRIAAAALGDGPAPARIAAAWPRWFAANRAVIGDDPAYLVPGEVLHAPEGPR